MILHISYDQKFIDNVITQFEEVSKGENIYLILVDKKNYRLKHVFFKSEVNIIIQQKNRFNIRHFLLNHSEITGILFHSLSPARAKMLLKIKEEGKYKIGWMGWGTEVYSNSLIIKSSIIQPLTKKIIRNSNTLSLSSTISTIKNLVYYLKEGFVSPQNMIKKAILKVDYCMPVFKEEYLLYKQLLPEFNATYLPFNYGYINLFLGNISIDKMNGDDILIGNSASPYNNHVDAFYKIKDYSCINNHKIIVPLSYGETKYQKTVNEIGIKLFSNNFIGLMSFMALDDYIKLISKCRYVIMNNNRQQGMGNIIVLIWLGAKVFINKSTTTWDFFKRIGVKIFSIEDDLSENAFIPLTSEMINNNKIAIEKEYSKDVVLKRTKKVFNSFYN